jgi:hypothetical protein
MRKRAPAVVALAALTACSAPHPRAPKGDVVLTFEGKIENGPFRFGRDDLPTLPRRAFKAVSPFTADEVRFEGVRVAALVSEGVMELKRDADTAVIHGRNGYAVAVPVAALRLLKPVLADKVDGAPVDRWRSVATPFQLAWPNLERPGIDTDPRLRWWWVEGVISVELQSWLPTYGRALRVPPGASDDARLGAEALSVSCLACHRLRGVGGTRGPELGAAAIQRDPDGFVRRMRDHLATASGMPGAPPVAAATAEHIAAFLRAVEISGTRPEDEIQPQEPAPNLPPPGSPTGSPTGPRPPVTPPGP